MNDIDVFYNSEIILKRKSFKINYYIFFISVFIIILFIFLCFFKYHPYQNLKAVILKEQDSYYLKTLVPEDKISDINNNFLIVQNKLYKYKIKNISKDYVLDEKYNKYYEVLLKAKIDSKLLINNNIIDVSIELPKTTFVKEILKKIKKGMR